MFALLRCCIPFFCILLICLFCHSSGMFSSTRIFLCRSLPPYLYHLYLVFLRVFVLQLKSLSVSCVYSSCVRSSLKYSTKPLYLHLHFLWFSLFSMHSSTFTFVCFLFFVNFLDKLFGVVPLPSFSMSVNSFVTFSFKLSHFYLTLISYAFEIFPVSLL